MKRMTLLGVVLLMVLAACNRANVDSIQRDPNGGVDLTVSLTESEVNTMITAAITRAEDVGHVIRVQNPNVDLQVGQIVLSGEYEQQNGTGNYVTGSITLAVTTQDGHAHVSVSSVNISGLQANDERLTAMTDRINQALDSRASRDNGPNITLTAITVTDTDLSMTLHVTR